MIYLPIYEYQCSNGHNQVVAAPINADHEKPDKCDKCGENLVRLFGSPSVQFKGTGWGKD
jgi:putative FmdB family regulatory protein